MDKTYYQEMLKKERLIPFFKDNKLLCFVSFFITNNPDIYIQRDNPWTVLDDEPETGKIAYIDQIWSDRTAHKYSFEIWKRLVNFIKSNYSLVNIIRWNRWKNNRLYVFEKRIV